MLLIAKKLRDLEFARLMDVYIEGNRENAADVFPHLPPQTGLLAAEADFRQYLQEIFFPTPGAFYAVWEENGIYCSALRLEPYQDGLLLEALETAPEYRRQGYGKALLQAVLVLTGQKKIYSHVHKRNLPSLNIHKACGFRKILDHAVYADGSVLQSSCTLLHE